MHSGDLEPEELPAEQQLGRGSLCCRSGAQETGYPAGAGHQGGKAASIQPPGPETLPRSL
jgi:hypothetical protein